MLELLLRSIPRVSIDVPLGHAVLDWTVPREWNIRDAFIARQDGTRIVDFAANDRHIVQYSRPIDAILSLAELRPHLIHCPINRTGFRIVPLITTGAFASPL